MPVLGKITALLAPKYREAGYILNEDEDFVYLYCPGDPHPHIFSAVGATIESIQKYIELEESLKLFE